MKSVLPTKDELVWYAGYGSNLSAERFKYYILGGYFNLNNQDYQGCTDKTLWRDTVWNVFSGEMYFGNKSKAWNRKGVCFFDPNGPGKTIMRMYKITFGQLLEIQKQEGATLRWYEKLIKLGTWQDGCEIYTFTSKKHRPLNKPDEKYFEVIKKALIEECGLSAVDVEKYLKNK